ncbi:MAG: hypothetical protein JO199_03310 [Candidatus Eremiobacteraeota bacterium]|nr:hypothetical protein [Candidatus Eremiobacteraeota bacterium]
MTKRTAWLPQLALAALVLAGVGCQAVATNVSPPSASANGVRGRAIADVYPTPQPSPAKYLYVDHLGMLAIYRLPLTANSTPMRVLDENPGGGAPAIAVDAYGEIAIGTTTEVRLYQPPIVSLAAKDATVRVHFTPAVTAIGPSGADIVGMVFDPSLNLWLLSGIGGEVTELQRPITPASVAASTVLFGVKGTKTSGFGILGGASFDISGTLYVYAINSGLPPPYDGQLFKLGFPYVKPISTTGLNLSQADFVDTSQFLPSNPNPVPALLGLYNGPLHSPPPQVPPPAPVDELAQFASPLNSVTGPFPTATVSIVIGALIADPPRTRIYTLESTDGRLAEFAFPLQNRARALLTLRCPFKPSNCNEKPEHLYLVQDATTKYPQ